MTSYKHTQIGYLMLVVLLAVLILFSWIQITARAEPPSYYSGTNFGVTAVMALILFILASFTTLSVSIDEKYLRIKFGYGIFRKKFSVSEIALVAQVKNHWHYGWGMRLWFWPRPHLQTSFGRDLDQNLSDREGTPQGVPLGTLRTSRQRVGGFWSDPKRVAADLSVRVVASREPMPKHMSHASRLADQSNQQAMRLEGGLEMGSYMWIFNVSGFDAVEIRMKRGKIYRIGTDEPEKLETAIKQVIHS